MMDIHLVAGTCEIPDVGVFLRRLEEIASGYGITVQAIDADRIAGRAHIISATEKAVRAIARSENISNDLGMEILLYASGNRQIKKAIAMGIAAGRNNVVLVAVGGEVPDGAVSELEDLVDVEGADVISYGRAKRDAIVSFFGITESEIAVTGEEKIPDLVLERVALTGLWKSG